MEDISPLKKPEWIKVRLPAGNEWKKVDGILAAHGLHTVCDEARCPNKGECWGCGTATFMILGDECTRNCRFCAVATSKTGKPVRDDEPEALAQAVSEMGLEYAVLTSVDRDDLEDKGSGHFARCIQAIRQSKPSVKIEVLIPDYNGPELATVAAAAPDVLAHNIETVRRLQSVRDARSGYESSLRTLREAKDAGISIIKSSILLGLGETLEELREAFTDLRSAGVDILVMGQYLRPSPRQVPIHEYLHPEAFRLLAKEAESAGFSSVISSPFARTSYHALDAWFRGRSGDGKAHS